jgi:fumarylpyruvate hydrolase
MPFEKRWKTMTRIAGLMGKYVFDIEIPSVAISGNKLSFPVHRIYCIGKNYAAHTREMGGDPDRQPPVFFMKNSDAVAKNGSTIAYPPATNDLHHEIEMVVAIGVGGNDIDASRSRHHVFGYAVGIDLTRRDLQGLAKVQGGPWDTAKSFEQAAPITAIHEIREIGHPESGRIWLAVNGDLRQEGDIADMIWTVNETIAELSTLFTLAPGDLIFTGTPAGVGAVSRGDHITGGIDGIDEISIEIE